MAEKSLHAVKDATLDELEAALRGTDAEAEALGRPELAAFVKMGDGKVDAAAQKVAFALKARENRGPVSILDVAPFLRSPPGSGRKYPDGCVFVLEDMKGGVRRDNLGRPMMVSIGMSHGSAEEMQMQQKYAMQRAAAYTLPHLPPHASTVVIEVRPREAGAPASFRFPDKDFRTLFDMQQQEYPSAVFSTTHFCGLPRMVTWTFSLVRPFMRKETYDAMVLKPSFSHLFKHMPSENMLKQWGGSLDFDIDEYVEWRAREEGVDSSLLCSRGHGRAFDVSKSATGEDSLNSSLKGSITARALLAGECGEASGEAPRKHGAVEKRGSGKGLFSTMKWKAKLLVVSDVGLVYFDELAETDANTAARVLQLGPNDRVERRGVIDGRHAFAFVQPAREYLFGVTEDQEAEAWISEIQKQMAVVNDGLASVPASMDEADLSADLQLRARITDGDHAGGQEAPDGAGAQGGEKDASQHGASIRRTSSAFL